MSKHIYYIFAFCFTILAIMSSCNMGEVPSKDEFASRNLVFYYSEAALYEQLFTLDMGSKVNAYAMAQTDSEKLEIYNLYLKPFKISKTGNNWQLTKENETWTFTTNGLPIDGDGAQWNIELLQNGVTKIPSGGFTVLANGKNSWTLTCNNMQSEITNRLESQTDYNHYFSYTSYATFSVTAKETDSIEPFVKDYIIESGNGGFVPNKMEDGHYNVTVNYAINRPLNLKYNSSIYIFASGSIGFQVVYSNDLPTESFEANIYTTPSDWTIKYE